MQTHENQLFYQPADPHNEPLNNIETKQGFGQLKKRVKKSRSKSRSGSKKRRKSPKRKVSPRGKENKPESKLESQPEIKLSADLQQVTGDAGILAFKTAQCEKYFTKCIQLKQQVNKLKQDLHTKDQLLTRQKSIFKEVKLMKDQWKATEVFRSEQAKQIQALQAENAQLKQ
jgi:hypothetical protein